MTQRAPKILRSVMLVGWGIVCAQTTPNVKQQAISSPCSNIVALAGNATVDCSSLTAQQRKIIDGIPSVLNKILANQLDTDAVMTKLDEILKAVNPNAPQTTYTFNGFKRVISPGRVSGGDDGAGAVFQEMGRLETAKDWASIITVAERQMKERPEWLTPYVFAGAAYLNLGNKPKALEALEYAERRIANNPDYEPLQKPMQEMLTFLRSR